ncbi:thiol-disulfide oxidoreductase DCC family protein [Halostella sp. PRR32]|uniref:thiol-disulfide oxidoreductase DCC family protein n=1 Tax=Halostella sp. PRR32 TaxID=3098147 RepID=UPI002B1DFCFB|nr:thiol-disulfide oxidoreductase DCC family protein [Halostella sp. PRR32]
MTADKPDGGPVVLFDGVCDLCSGFVQFIVPRDPEATFRFAPLQSDVGKALLAEHDLPTDELESVVLIEGDDCYVKTDAVLRIATHLGGMYALLRPARIVPRSLRDRIYDFVAANRYRWFGEKDRCEIPDGDVRGRLLE